MEAVWKIEVENFPAFILVDDKGTDFFKQLGLKSRRSDMTKPPVAQAAWGFLQRPLMTPLSAAIKCLAFWRH